MNTVKVFKTKTENTNSVNDEDKINIFLHAIVCHHIFH